MERELSEAPFSVQWDFIKTKLFSIGTKQRITRTDMDSLNFRGRKNLRNQKEKCIILLYKPGSDGPWMTQSMRCRIWMSSPSSHSLFSQCVDHKPNLRSLINSVQNQVSTKRWLPVALKKWWFNWMITCWDSGNRIALLEGCWINMQQGTKLQTHNLHSFELPTLISRTS